MGVFRDTPDCKMPPCSVSSSTNKMGVIVSSRDQYNHNSSSSISPAHQLLYSQTGRKQLDNLKFDPEDLALATVPGADFDPRERTFAVDELKPQPIIRKRPKIFVSDDSKDERYWEKRFKNNVAARRSREARRLKENQIALRAAYLEQENNQLKIDLQDSKFNSKLQIERDILKQKLLKYEFAQKKVI